MTIVDQLREAGLAVDPPRVVGAHRPATKVRVEPSGEAHSSDRAARNRELQAAARSGAVAFVSHDGRVTMVAVPTDDEVTVVVAAKSKQAFTAKQKDAVAALSAVLKHPDAPEGDPEGERQ